MSTCDGVLLGAGHNALILQAYLGRAGLQTVCLERGDAAGGGLATIEHPAGSGFLHNTHSFFHRGVTRLPWYRDLELERRGARYIQPPLNVALLLSDGRHLAWWDDFDRTAASFAAISPRDADTMRRWRDAFVPIVERILEPEAAAPPLPPDERRRRLSSSVPGRTLLEVSQLSPVEFVRREFEHPAVQAALLFFNGLREVDLLQRGFGHHVPSLLASRRMAQMCIGGAKRLADALVDAVRESGGEVRLQTTPRRILVERGRAAGVETTAGDVIHARKFVVSGLNPQQTFLELIDPRHLPRQWIERAERFQYNLLAPLFALNVNLSEPPRFESAGPRGELDEALMVIVGLDHADRFDEIVAHHHGGTIPPAVMWGSCPTRFDPSQAPPGRHTAFMWEKVPYALDGDAARWDDRRRRHSERMLEAWGRRAPNLPAAVLDRFARTPLDTERTLPNMCRGDLLVGSFSAGQFGYHRPFPGAGNYRGHLAGLYLCGSSCHPGGNITGLAGYNCAQVLLADLGIQAAWFPPPIEYRSGSPGK